MSSISINAIERTAKAPQRMILRKQVSREMLKPEQKTILLKDYDFTPETSQVDPDSKATEQAAKNIMGGMAIGAAAGAAIGSVIPVAGTAAGAMVGAFVGAVGGTAKCIVDIFKKK